MYVLLLFTPSLVADIKFVRNASAGVFPFFGKKLGFTDRAAALGVFFIEAIAAKPALGLFCILRRTSWATAVVQVQLFLVGLASKEEATMPIETSLRRRGGHGEGDEREEEGGARETVHCGGRSY